MDCESYEPTILRQYDLKLIAVSVRVGDITKNKKTFLISDWVYGTQCFPP